LKCSLRPVLTDEKRTLLRFICAKTGADFEREAEIFNRVAALRVNDAGLVGDDFTCTAHFLLGDRTFISAAPLLPLLSFTRAPLLRKNLARLRSFVRP
jgi:hypothetical protein